jgi:hypothetical protein
MKEITMHVLQHNLKSPTNLITNATKNMATNMVIITASIKNLGKSSAIYPRVLLPVAHRV